jgi:transposase-like protein
MVLEQGLSASKVARDLGVSQPSLSRWLKDSQRAAIPYAITNAER